MRQRRTLLLALLATPLATSLSSCGFYLRGSQPTPANLRKSMAVDFLAAPSLQEEFTNRYSQGGGTIVAEDAKPELSLQVQDFAYERVLVANNVQGLATEYQLRMRVVFSVTNAKKEVVLKQANMRVTRDMSFSEANALAKEYEEVQLKRDMQTDLVQQMLYRIAAIK